MNVLQAWMTEASPREKEKLAKLANTTVNVLRVTAGGYKADGTLRLAAEFAQRLSTASHEVERPGLPALYQEDMCPACATCKYQVQCNK
jgi:hypothetical protein